MKNLSEDKAIKQALAIKKVLIRLEKDIELHSDLFITAITHGHVAIEKWTKTNEQLHHEVETDERILEELQAFIAVGYPQCMHTNASSVLDKYKRKVEIYNAKQSGISLSDEDVVRDWDNGLTPEQEYRLEKGLE